MFIDLENDLSLYVRDLKASYFQTEEENKALNLNTSYMKIYEAIKIMQNWSAGDKSMNDLYK